MWHEYNPNPYGIRAGDCAVRAIVAVTGKKWEEVYMDLCVLGLKYGDWGSKNHIWGAYLRDLGYEREAVSNDSPEYYTVEKFAEDHPDGVYILAISGHVVALINGDWFDSWDSGQCIPVYYWRKKGEE